MRFGSSLVVARPKREADSTPSIEALLKEPTILVVKPTPEGLDECYALDVYSEPPEGLTRLAKLFNEAKYQRTVSSEDELKQMMAAGVSIIAGRKKFSPDAAIVPVGSSSQLALELARSAASALRAPLLPVFGRPAGPKLKNISANNRRAVAANRVSMGPGARCPSEVILVDDLIQTGWTASAAAGALRSVGAKRVVAVTAVWIRN